MREKEERLELAAFSHCNVLTIYGAARRLPLNAKKMLAPYSWTSQPPEP
jgi:hypothetical protein